MSRPFSEVRRQIAIRSQWFLAVIGLGGLVCIPFIWQRGLEAIALLVVASCGTLGLALSMARTINMQREFRRSAARQEAASAKLSTAIKRLPQTAKADAASAPSKSGTRPSRLPGKDVTSGRLITGYGSDQLPVIAFIGSGLNESQVRRAVDDIAQCQLLTGAFKPLILLDNPYFSHARSYGYLVELIISEDDWSGGPAARRAYLEARLASLKDTYGCAGIVRLTSSGLEEFGELMVDQIAHDWANTFHVTLPESRRKRSSNKTSAHAEAAAVSV